MLQLASWNLPQAATPHSSEKPLLDADILTSENLPADAGADFTAEFALINELETTAPPEQLAPAATGDEITSPASLDITLQDTEALIQYWLGQQPEQSVASDAPPAITPDQTAATIPVDPLAALLNDTAKVQAQDTAALPRDNQADALPPVQQRPAGNIAATLPADALVDDRVKQPTADIMENQQRATMSARSNTALNLDSDANNTPANTNLLASAIRQADAASARDATPNPVSAAIVDSIESDLDATALRAPLTQNPATMTTSVGTPGSRAPEANFKFEGPEAKWGEQMLHALRNQVELQLQQRSQSATIRLDPPELGSMEIFLTHESGRLTVQISAAQTDVAKMLHQSSERLRQELTQQNFIQVNVQVGSGSDSQREQPGRHTAGVHFGGESISDNQLADEATDAQHTARNQDVLITV
ncbi:flagellar hook-length control protein FliK [Cellvibrio polysaccharolyticus]|nr:flagellar hook-length control protein FliK [Cellvibrio polysaccharolyticus]